MNPVQLPVAPNVAQPAAKAASRGPVQGSDAGPADGAEGGFAALMQQLSSTAGEASDHATLTPVSATADALAPETPLASAAPAEADPALLAMAIAMASQAVPHEAPSMAGSSLRGEALAPEAEAENTLAALDTRTLPQGEARVAGRAGHAAALERDAVLPREVPASPPSPAVPAPALLVEDARKHTAPQAVEGSSLELPAPAPLHLPAAPAASAAAAPALLEAHLQTRPGEPRFAHELATQLQVMVDGEIEHARLQLHPAELGPIHITMTVQAQTADIQFLAAHASTRQGLQDGLDELRRLLGEMGLQLGQANVGAGQQQHESGSQTPGASRRAIDPPGGGGSLGSDSLRPGRSVRETLGLLDLYA